MPFPNTNTKVSNPYKYNPIATRPRHQAHLQQPSFHKPITRKAFPTDSIAFPTSVSRMLERWIKVVSKVGLADATAIILVVGCESKNVPR